MKKIKKNFTIHRKRKIKSKFDFFVYMLCIGIFVAGVLIYIYPHFKIVDILYALESKKIEKNVLIKKNKFLQVELASLKRLDRIEKIARLKLGLVFPTGRQVIYIRKKEID